jgi:micrococcal nuclease
MRYVNKPNNTLEQELRAVQKTAEQKKLNVWSIEGYVENNRFQSNK